MQPKVDDSKKAKRALTLAQDIVRDIEAGAHVVGDRLAREDEMLARYDVARATLREALRFLELQGVIHLQLGRSGGPVVARRAKDGEQIEALNEKTYEMEAGMITIGDAEGVDDLAGVMGGERTGVSDDTTGMFLEIAVFDPISVATTGRKLNLNSDARYRFERGVDPDYMLPGLELATKLVMDLCGGEPSEVVVAGKVPDEIHIVNFPYREVKRLTGLEVSHAEINVTLKALGFWISGTGDTVKVAAPSWRPDVPGTTRAKARAGRESRVGHEAAPC